MWQILSVARSNWAIHKIKIRQYFCSCWLMPIHQIFRLYGIIVRRGIESRCLWLDLLVLLWWYDELAESMNGTVNMKMEGTFQHYKCILRWAVALYVGRIWEKRPLHAKQYFLPFFKLSSFQGLRLPTWFAGSLGLLLHRSNVRSYKPSVPTKKPQKNKA